MKREESASTFIGQGVAIPHVRMNAKDDFSIVVGRSVPGIKYDAARGALAHIIVLVITNEKTDNNLHIQVLTEIATFFKSDSARNQALAPGEGPIDVQGIIASANKAGVDDKTIQALKKGLGAGFGIAMDLAHDVKAAALMVFADTVRENDFLDILKCKDKLIVVTSNKTRFDAGDKRITRAYRRPRFPLPASARSRSAFCLRCRAISSATTTR